MTASCTSSTFEVQFLVFVTSKCSRLRGTSLIPLVKKEDGVPQLPSRSAASDMDMHSSMCTLCTGVGVTNRSRKRY